MKERPIIFSGESIRAIRERRKTQTRRAVKPQPPKWKPAEINGSFTWRDASDHFRRNLSIYDCPYGQPGDRLWVRETWRVSPPYDSYRAGELGPNCRPVWYAATPNRAREATDGGRMRPSIHMPRWASRLTLEILKIRVERVQEINVQQHDEVLREGWPWGKQWPKRPVVADFAEMWDQIHANHGFAWDANPLVWVIEFRALSPAENPSIDGPPGGILAVQKLTESRSE